jgi:lipoprotein-releasing system permease protein
MIRPILFFGVRQLSSKSAERSYRRIRGAVVGISLAIVPMIMVIQVSGGLIRGISERYIEVGSFHLQARNFTGVEDDEFAVRATLARSVSGVKSVNEIRYGLGLLQSESGRTGVSVQALPSGIADSDPVFKKYLEILDGKFDLSEEDSLLVSQPIAEQLGVEIGDELRLLTARSTSTGKYILRQSGMKVAGIFTTGYHDLDEMTVLISPVRGARLFKEDGSRVLAIKVENPFDDLDDIRERLQSALGRNWYVFTWYQLEESMYSTFETTQNLLLLIMAIIVIVAGVNISGSLIMLVMEKERDIAILRSAGVKAKDISAGFLFLGLTIGVIGTIFGMLLGILAAVHVNWIITGLEHFASWIRYGALLITSRRGAVEYKDLELLSSSFYLNQIPVVIGAKELFFTAALSISVALLASVAPARRASKMLPVEILRRH